MLPGNDQPAALGVDIGKAARLQRSSFLPQPAQSAEKIKQPGILPPPGVRPPVQRVFKALHPGLIAVEQRGRAGKAVQQHPSQPQLGPSPGQLGGREGKGCPLLLGGRDMLCAQQRQDAGRVVCAQKVHRAVKRGGWIIGPQRLHALPELCRVAAAQPPQQRRAERVVHQPVGLPAQQIPPPLGIGDLIAAVLPHLAQQVAIRLFILDGAADTGDEVAGQLIRHVQSPAVRAAPQPVPYHAVLALEDELPVGGPLLVDGGQRFHAPPGVVVRGPGVEAVPVVIGGVLTLGRPKLRIKAVRVEIPASRPGVVEHAVQHHPHPPFVGLPA